MSDLSSLIARLEAAEGPSRKLDILIASAADYSIEDFSIREKLEEHGLDYMRDRVENSYNSILRLLPEYTSSIDAAVSLAERVLPGWRYAIERRTGGMCLAWVTEEDDAPCIPAMHPHSAIALVLATLRALQQKGGTE